MLDYTFGNDEIAQRIVTDDGQGNVTTQTHIFGHDGHGSVRVLYDLAATTAAITQAFTFAPYGEMIALHNDVAQSIAVTNRLSNVGYSGEHFDAKAQQQYLRARFYNPANGRFNRLDPYAGSMQDPQSLHKYAYVHGDPVQGIDPSGLSALFFLLHLQRSAAAGLTLNQLASTSGFSLTPGPMKNGATGSIDPSDTKGLRTYRYWEINWPVTSNTMVVQRVNRKGRLNVELKNGRKFTFTYNETYIESWTNPGKARESFNHEFDRHIISPPGRALEKLLKGNFFVLRSEPNAVMFKDASGMYPVFSWDWQSSATFEMTGVPSSLPPDKSFYNVLGFTNSVLDDDPIRGRRTIKAPSQLSDFNATKAPWLQFPLNGRILRATETHTSTGYQYGTGQTRSVVNANHGDYQ